jgi:hypothetical protein
MLVITALFKIKNGKSYDVEATDFLTPYGLK